MTGHPGDWRASRWHPDFGDPEVELRLLRAFAMQFLKCFPDGGVELIHVEEGYMHVDLFLAGHPIGEVHIVERGAGKPGRWYGLFLSGGKQAEKYFSSAKEGVDFIASASRKRRGNGRARKTAAQAPPTNAGIPEVGELIAKLVKEQVRATLDKVIADQRSAQRR